MTYTCPIFLLPVRARFRQVRQIPVPGFDSGDGVIARLLPAPAGRFELVGACFRATTPEPLDPIPAGWVLS